MKISFCCADTQPEPWLDGLRAALPEANVALWAPGAPHADYAVVWAPPQQFFDEQTQLRGIFTIGAGVDALLQLKLPPGVPLHRLEDAGMAVQMAEYVCHAVIRYFREFDAMAADAATGTWRQRNPRLRSEFTVGLLGLGVLGQRVAQSLRAFEFPVIGWSRKPKVLEGIRCLAGREQLPDVLAASRVLVCLLPLTPETQDILNRQTLQQLPRGSYLVNVARGGHLVDQDLLDLLDGGHLAGATLDVFRTEPLPREHAFWRHPKITVTPHTSARTLRAESIAQIAQKIRAMQRGEPSALVNLERGY